MFVSYKFLFKFDGLLCLIAHLRLYIYSRIHKYILNNQSIWKVKFSCLKSYTSTICICEMDLLLLGSYTRLSCTLIKWNLYLVKITIHPPLNHPIPSYWMNDKWCLCLCRWRQFFQSKYPLTFYISIVLPGW